MFVYHFKDGGNFITDCPKHAATCTAVLYNAYI